MRISFFCTILLICILFSCGNNKTNIQPTEIQIQPYPHKIDLIDGINSPVDLSLSEIADSIDYILLSTNKDAPISWINSVELTEDDIFIMTHTETSYFFRFDKKGKFLNSIGKVGRGPGEYLSGSYFFLDPFLKKVYVKQNFIHDYLTFDYEGHFLGKAPFKKGYFIAGAVVLPNNHLLKIGAYVEKPERFPKDFFLCGLFDQNDSTLQIIKHPITKIPDNLDKPFLTSGFLSARYSFFNGEPIISGLEDTIYKANSDSIYKAFILLKGDFAPTYLQNYTNDAFAGSMNYLKNNGLFFETKTKAYIQVSLKEKGYIFEYNKLTGKSKSKEFIGSLDHGVYAFDWGFQNDLDGGIKFFPQFTNREGSIWIMCKDAIDFKKEIEVGNMSNPNSLDPFKKKKLKVFNENLTSDDNPVLMIVYLKKQI